MHGNTCNGKTQTSERLSKGLTASGVENIIINTQTLLEPGEQPLRDIITNPDTYNYTDKEAQYFFRSYFLQLWAAAQEQLKQRKTVIFDDSTRLKKSRIDLLKSCMKYNIPLENTVLLHCECEDEIEHLGRFITRASKVLEYDLEDTFCFSTVYNGLSKAILHPQKKDEELVLKHLGDLQTRILQYHQCKRQTNLDELVHHTSGQVLFLEKELLNAQIMLNYLRITTQPLDMNSSDKYYPLIKYSTLTQDVKTVHLPYQNKMLIEAVMRFLIKNPYDKSDELLIADKYSKKLQLVA